MEAREPSIQPCNKNTRVLVIDDNPSIHEDFRKILCPAADLTAATEATEAALFGRPIVAVQATPFEVDSAFQGQEGLQRVTQALAAGRPYAMAFVDVRMPPGWDGVETTRNMWAVDPDLQIVLCTAYSDHAWHEVFEKLGRRDGLLILKKPFDAVEALQLAHALTEKRWLQKQSRLRLDELENLVAERTRAMLLTQAQLFQSQKLQTVGTLAGGIAHEFNSILTTILGQSALLLAGLPIGGPQAAQAADISRAAGRAAALTRQLLAYGRKQTLQPDTLDLNQVVASMEEMIRHLLPGKVATQILAAPDLHRVKADAGQIEQVILNLVVNARDAMPLGGTLTLETANVTLDPESAAGVHDLKPGPYVMLAITDTGTGMSEEVKAHLFEPFFTTKGVGQGVGLGLSTCYGIVKQSGGEMLVSSESGRGATFRVYLPQVNQETTVPRQPPALLALPHGTETILLAEPDAALREMIATLLGRLGYTVLAAASGMDACRLTQKRHLEQIDLLLTEIAMPRMSGRELSRLLRGSHPHLRVLFTSAFAKDAQESGLVEAEAHLQKPFTPSALAQRLREVLAEPND